MGDDQKRQEKKQSLLKTGWKMLPLTVKLWIIGGVVALFFIIILVTAVAGIIPSNFLDYSDEAQTSDNLKDEYEEFWQELCGDDSENCSEEQKRRAKELQESQEKFYKQLDNLVKKENLSAEEKYTILATIFYNYEIDDFTSENDAFYIDEDDEINYEVVASSENIYRREKDSLKELVKQFKVNTVFCITGEGENETKEALKRPDGVYFTYNFFESFLINVGIYPDTEGFKEAANACEGRVKAETSTDSAVSIEGYYRYLRDSDYLDTRPQNISIFESYAKSHDLDEDSTLWPSEDRIVVRERIIEDIKDIVANKMSYTQDDKTYISFGTDDGYWWPIGSSETTSANGKLYALGPPHAYTVTSEAAGRLDPFTGKPSTHSGMDIAPGGAAGTVPAIAAKSGTVVFPPADANINYGNGSGINGSTYGNYVIIQHTDGNYTLYGHLHAGTIMVRQGDSVERGQVIGYIGSSGRSTGPHLHFEVREGQNSYYNVVDPRKYIKEDDPRPSSSLSTDFVAWFDANFEGTTGTDSTGTKYLVKDVGDGVRTAGPGVVLESQAAKFAARGINVAEYPNGSYIDKEIVDSIKGQVLEEAYSSIEATLSNAGLTLEKEKIQALVVFKYNVGNIGGFTDAYKEYGDTQALYDNYFGRYVHVKGEVWPGLVKRRQKEWELFHNHVYV